MNIRTEYIDEPKPTGESRINWGEVLGYFTIWALIVYTVIAFLLLTGY